MPEGKNYKLLILSLFALIYLENKAVAQDSLLLDSRITITLDRVRLDSALNRISRITGIPFSYTSRHIPASDTISLNTINKPVRELLNDLLYNRKIEYSWVEDQLVLKPERSTGPGIAQASTKYQLSGFIRDSASFEILIGATIYFPELYAGTTTNGFGFFSLTLPSGSHQCTISYLGYQPTIQTIHLYNSVVTEFELSKSPELLKEVVIESEGTGQLIHKTQMGNVNIHSSSVEKMPALLGEVDVIKSLHSIPGIKLFGDGSTIFYVRGGNRDQNMILLDDAPIFNPTHLFGFFSTIIPEAIKDIQVYKGDIPAGYGGRLSSLVNIRTKDGNMNRTGFSGSSGFLSTRISAEGPIAREKSSFFISGRRSYFKWIFNNANSNIDKLQFFDLTSKFNVKINASNRLFLSMYTGEDKFYERQFGIRWNNVAGSIRWNHLFNSRLFSNTTIYTSQYKYFLYASIPDNNFWNSAISNLSFKTDFTYFHLPGNTIRFGFLMGGHGFVPGNFSQNGVTNQDLFPQVAPKNASEFVLYFDHEFKPFEWLGLHYGIRMPLWFNIGSATEYVFNADYSPIWVYEYEQGEVYRSTYSFEPRLGVTLALSDRSSVKAGYSRTSQYIHLLSNSISPFTSLEIWLPTGPNLRPQYADMGSIGYHSKVGKGIELQIESYYKKMYNQVDYAYHSNMFMNPLLEGEIRYGKSWSYGIEFLLKKETGIFSGWIGYTYSRTWKRIQDLYGNATFPAFYDRPHDLNIFASYKLTMRWQLSANWIYSSGAAITTPTGFYEYMDQTLPFYGKKNNDRLPDYHRLDLSIHFKLNKPERRYNHNLILSIYNTYGRKNPVFLNFNKIESPGGNYVIPTDLYSQETMVPTEIFLHRMIPSLTYQFKF